MLFSQSRLEISIVVEVLASMGSNDINIWSKVLVKGFLVKKKKKKKKEGTHIKVIEKSICM